jgi:predicted Zn finger-like uncharacterized protein
MGMKLSCPTCNAKYSIADDKVRGRVVKIRCKKCGAIVIARGDTPDEQGGQVCAPPEHPEPSPTPRTGERNEESVLFSLSALRRPPAWSPPPPPTTEGSGLLDIRMLARALPTEPARRTASDDIVNLGFGGVLAPQILTCEQVPASAPIHAAPERARSRRWVVHPALIGPMVSVVALIVPLSLMRRTAVAPVSAVPVVAAPVAAPEVAVLATPNVDAGALPEVAPPPLVARAIVAPAHVAMRSASTTPGERAAPLLPARPVDRSARCCPGETETACEMRRSVGAACAVTAPTPPATDVGAFDGAAAARALSAVSLRACSRAGGPVGPGHARVTFEPGGNVSGVVVDSPELSGTATERCVAQAYRRVRIGAFSGPALTVGKRFVLAEDGS